MTGGDFRKASSTLHVDECKVQYNCAFLQSKNGVKILHDSILMLCNHFATHIVAKCAKIDKVKSTGTNTGCKAYAKLGRSKSLVKYRYYRSQTGLPCQFCSIYMGIHASSKTERIYF